MKKLVEGNELLNSVPQCSTTGKGPVVRLQSNLILDDGNCFECPTLIEGNVGTGKSYLMMNDLMNPILEYCDRSGDNAVIFCAKPEMLRYRRNGNPMISIKNMEPESCWSIFAEMKASDNPELTLREISTELFAEAEEKTTQIFFPQAARDIFYQELNYKPFNNVIKKHIINKKEEANILIVKRNDRYGVYDLNGNVLSLILKVQDHSYVESATILYFRSYNINLKNSEVLSNEKLLSMFDISTSDAENKLNEKIKNYYDSLVEDYYIDSDECSYSCFLDTREFDDENNKEEYYVKNGKLYAFKPYTFISTDEEQKIVYKFKIS